MDCEAPFKRSWSVYHPLRANIVGISNNDYFESQKNLQRSMSIRQPKINLERRFGESQQMYRGDFRDRQSIGVRKFFNKGEALVNEWPKQCDSPIVFNNRMKARSITDTNLHSLKMKGFGNAYKNLHSSPSAVYRRQPLARLPDRIPPIWKNIQNNVSQAGPKTERFIQRGGEKLSKAIHDVRTSINSFSQRFKNSTKRHYKLDNPPRTPGSLGRTPPSSACITPGKLYSPFDMNTPRTPHSYMKGPKRLQYGYHNKRMAQGKENYGQVTTPSYHHPPQRECVGGWVNFDSPSHIYENTFSSPGIPPPFYEGPPPLMDLNLN